MLNAHRSRVCTIGLFFPLQQIEALAQFERVMVNLLGLKDVILLIVD